MQAWFDSERGSAQSQKEPGTTTGAGDPLPEEGTDRVCLFVCFPKEP